MTPERQRHAACQPYRFTTADQILQVYRLRAAQQLPLAHPSDEFTAECRLELQARRFGNVLAILDDVA